MGDRKTKKDGTNPVERQASADALKEIRSAALSIRRKLDDSDIDHLPNVMEEYHSLVERFYKTHKDAMAPQQYRAAKHDFDYFLRLVNLAIHYCESETRSRSFE